MTKQRRCGIALALMMIGTANGCTPESTKPEVQSAVDFNPLDIEPVPLVVHDISSRSDESVSHQVESAFRRALLAKGYDVVTRSKVDAVRMEIDFQKAQGAEQEIFLGRRLGSPSILVVTISYDRVRGDAPTHLSNDVPVYHHYDECFLEAQLLSTRNEGVSGPSVLWSGHITTYKSSDEQGTNRAAILAATEIANLFPQKSP